MIPAIFMEIKCRPNSRYDLDRPFVHDGWLYATDGKILVRRPVDGIETEILDDWRDPARKLVNLDPLLKSVSFDGAITVELPVVPEKCPCKPCHGTGEVDFVVDDDYGLEIKLLRKGKPVFVDCENCDGTGQVNNDEPVKVCDEPVLYLLGRYVGFLRHHGVKTVQISTSEHGSPTVDFKTNIVGFEGRGFTGLLMPMDVNRAEEDLRRQAS